MFSSSISTFMNSSSVSPTRVYVDNNNSMLMSYLVDEFNPSYHIPSPLNYEIDIFGESYISPQEITLIQQALRPNSSIGTEDSSTFGVTNKTMDEDFIHKNNEVMKRPSGSSHESIKRSRTSKRDRHSKIRTAHGLRDRRMRLSLDVACPFFKLQDMLGYDKASSTVEWLLIQSKPAIEELFQTLNPSPSGVTKCSMSNSTSNCEVESTMVEEIIKKRPTSSKPKKARNMPKKKRKILTTKESREEARARARKKTLERMETRLLLPNHDHQILRRTHSSQTPNIINHASLSTQDYSSLSSFNSPQSSHDQISQTIPNMMGGTRSRD